VDPQGNPLPGVTVTINSGFNAVGVTDGQGFFTFVALPGGSYTLKAEIEGFSTKEYVDIRISDGETKSVEIPMDTVVEDVITVGATPPPLDLRKKPESPAYDFDTFGEMAKGLQQGLVGGVKPLNVAVPETGKVLLLTGILPPAEVAAELEVRAQKR